MIQKDSCKGGVVFIAPTLPIDVVVMARALEANGRLSRLVTRSCFTEPLRGWAAKTGFPAAWTRRPAAPVDSSKLRRVWSSDLRQRAGGWFNENAFATLDAAFAAVDRVAAKFVTNRTRAVVAREDSCLASFERARHLRIPRIYVMPTAHHSTVHRLIRRETTEFPELFSNGEISADFAPTRAARKDTELEMATHIVCPSGFVRDSLRSAGFAPERLVTLAFGTECGLTSCATMRRDPLFLYVGKISARKGVHRLIRVWKQLGAYRTHRLRLIGELALPKTYIKAYRNVFEHVPRLPRESLSEEYSKAQAFVFNALADGFGHVVGEAMACGTPVLASRNSGAPDLIRDESEGRLVEYGDEQALGSVLDWALTHPAALADMGRAARNRALERNWNLFAGEFVAWMTSVI